MQPKLSWISSIKPQLQGLLVGLLPDQNHFSEKINQVLDNDAVDQLIPTQFDCICMAPHPLSLSPLHL